METLDEFKTKLKDMDQDELIKQMFELSNQVFELKRLLFSRSSEKSRYDTSAMRGLFDEFEATVFHAEESDKNEEDPSESENGKKPDKRKNNTGKKKRQFSEDIPRKVIHIDLPEDQKICSIHNVPLKKVGESKSEKVKYIPASAEIIETITYNYKCTCCEKESDKAEFVSSKREPEILPGSIATPELLAHLITAKFDDGLPLFRQQEILRRTGINLHRSTMARWVVNVGEQTTPLVNLMKDDCHLEPCIHVDETTVQVLQEPNRPASANSYMWVMGSQNGRKIIIFQYHKSRSKKAAVCLLDGYTGYVTADGYGVYDSLAASPVVGDLIDTINNPEKFTNPESFTLAGCMAHCRRKFDSAIKQAKKEKTVFTVASQAKKRIDQLYAIEDRIKKRSPDEKLKIRQEKSVPILTSLKEWLLEMQPQVLPQSLTGKAITYALNQWEKLVRFCESGYINIDNNFAERAIRQFVIGRKNWIFVATPAGADATANLYSLVETAKLNGLCPNSYLTIVFKELPKCANIENLEKLLPYNISKHHSVNPYV